MATLDPTIQKLLNAFSQSQPALNLVGVPSIGLDGKAAPGATGVPSGRSGIQLGDLLASALAGGDAANSTYEPGTPANWPVPPTTTAGALDDLAPKLIQGMEYDPTTTGNWASTPPATLKAALDRLAAACVAAGHTP